MSSSRTIFDELEQFLQEHEQNQAALFPEYLDLADLNPITAATPAPLGTETNPIILSDNDSDNEPEPPLSLPNQGNKKRSFDTFSDFDSGHEEDLPLSVLRQRDEKRRFKSPSDSDYEPEFPLALSRNATARKKRRLENSSDSTPENQGNLPRHNDERRLDSPSEDDSNSSEDESTPSDDEDSTPSEDDHITPPPANPPPPAQPSPPTLRLTLAIPPNPNVNVLNSPLQAHYPSASSPTPYAARPVTSSARATGLLRACPLPPFLPAHLPPVTQATTELILQQNIAGTRSEWAVELARWAFGGGEDEGEEGEGDGEVFHGLGGWMFREELYGGEGEGEEEGEVFHGLDGGVFRQEAWDWEMDRVVGYGGDVYGGDAYGEQGWNGWDNEGGYGGEVYGGEWWEENEGSEDNVKYHPEDLALTPV